MKTKLVVLMFSAFMLSACIVQTRRGGGLEVIPILPAVVELDGDGYYAHGGYHYFYNNERWYYSSTRNGTRSELPRSHWPRETHQRGSEHPR
ncbi:MAG TPA: hypothetical protein VF378_08710 [Geothrix sp.]|jgi:hypothetical protein